MPYTVNFGGGVGGVGSAVPGIAYASNPDQLTGWYEASWTNEFTGLAAGETVNRPLTDGSGPFSVRTLASVNRLVIPETGTYLISDATEVMGNNQSLSSSPRLRFLSRLRTATPGSAAATIGSPGDIYIRGQYGAEFASGSTEAEAVVQLTENDEVWAEYSALRENSATTATIDTQFSAVLLQAGPGPVGPEGPKGDTGDTGADGVGVGTDLSMSQTLTNVTVGSSTGDDTTLLRATQTLAGVMAGTDKRKLDSFAFVNAGDAGQVLAVNAAETAAVWVDQSGGASDFLTLTDTPSAFGTEGQVLTVNSDTDALEFGDLDLAITTNDDSLVITATVSVSV